MRNKIHRAKKVLLFSHQTSINDMIENLGVLKLSDCPYWYSMSDIIFMPSLLETFSSTYPEAMVMGKPIVTTDLDFAHEICRDAAAYYDPLSFQSAAEVIQAVAHDKMLCKTLINNGYKRLKQFPNLDEKYLLIMDWITYVSKIKSDK